MNALEAAKVLDLTPDATPEQIEARFSELRRKLEDKVAKAPTPGLQAKYRESLGQVTAAYEALTLAADGSALPVLKKQSAVSGQPSASDPTVASPTTPQSAVRTPQSGKKSNKEFIIVTLIAVAVLAAGGWFVMKTRAEKAEQARLEAEATTAAEVKAAAEKAEQARLAEAARREIEVARHEAEVRKHAEEAERVRVAADEKARQEKQAQQAAAIRASLAELKIAWEATEQDARAAERRTGEMRNDLRNVNTTLPEGRRAQAELIAQQEFTNWLGDQLRRHPARIARAQAEELLSARQLDEAAAALEKAANAQHQLDSEIAATRKSLFTLAAPVRIDVPAEATWELVDAYGQKTTGRGPAVVPDRPFGPLTLRASLATFAPKETSTTLSRAKEAILAIDFALPRITLNTHPQGATVFINGKPHAKTPASFAMPGPGPVKVELMLEGYDPVAYERNLTEGAVANWHTPLWNDDSGLTGVSYESNAQGEIVVTEITPKSPAMEAGFVKGTVLAAIKQGDKFVDLAGIDPFEFLKMLAGDPGTAAILRVRAPGSTTSREVSLTRVSRQELAERNRPIAEVHIICPNRGNARAMRLNVYLRDQKHQIARLGQLVLRMPPGQLTFEAGYWSARESFALEVTEGINYFRFENGPGPMAFVRLDPVAGRELAASCKVDAELDLK
jgi:hypothetical protein